VFGHHRYGERAKATLMQCWVARPLLDAAEAEGWSKCELRAEVSRRRVPVGAQPGGDFA
jgi:hypothetical protein